MSLLLFSYLDHCAITIIMPMRWQIASGLGMVSQEDQTMWLEGWDFEPVQILERENLEIEFSHVANDLISHCKGVPIKTLDIRAQWNFLVQWTEYMPGMCCALIPWGECLEALFLGTFQILAYLSLHLAVSELYNL